MLTKYKLSYIVDNNILAPLKEIEINIKEQFNCKSILKFNTLEIDLQIRKITGLNR